MSILTTVKEINYHGKVGRRTILINDVRVDTMVDYQYWGYTAEWIRKLLGITPPQLSSDNEKPKLPRSGDRI